MTVEPIEAHSRHQFNGSLARTKPDLSFEGSGFFFVGRMMTKRKPRKPVHQDEPEEPEVESPEPEEPEPPMTDEPETTEPQEEESVPSTVPEAEEPPVVATVDVEPEERKTFEETRRSVHGGALWHPDRG